MADERFVNILQQKDINSKKTLIKQKDTAKNKQIDFAVQPIV